MECTLPENVLYFVTAVLTFAVPIYFVHCIRRTWQAFQQKQEARHTGEKIQDPVKFGTNWAILAVIMLAFYFAAQGFMKMDCYDNIRTQHLQGRN